ncbi:C1 family peptidase [uncultured Methanobrevibacter sp.]|uniref:C1 family peptidase n=1 Tax=uncultured Methanobrevibacter sp. TaxID=253161 RepID=UPI0026203D6B|nr:C1 family peptidase [uncultured Methanobrevibacter sp.]
MFKRKNKFVLFFSLIVLLMVIPVSFASTNGTDLALDVESPVVSISEEDMLKASNDYYFDASLENDTGDGSLEKPYKYLTADRIKANCNIHLANGRYDLDSSKNIELVSIIGHDADKTVIAYGGQGFIVKNSLTLQNVTLLDCTIQNRGKITATNTIFSQGIGGSDSYGNRYGGAIYNNENYENTVLTISNCTFTDNYATYGGAIYMIYGTLDVSNSVFIGNSAYSYGGAIACDYANKVTISKSKFYNSSSLIDAGGAIYIKDSEFSGNTLEFVNSSANYGGAITTLKTTVDLSNIHCLNSSAVFDGGAIYHMYGNFTLTGSNLQYNHALNGGALFAVKSGALNVKNNRFEHNNASCAGAVYSLLNTLEVSLTNYNWYLDNTAEINKDVYVTDKFNLNLGNGSYAMFKVNPSSVGDLPSKFSLVDEGYVTVAKDQKNGGNCWAFAPVTALESCILKISNVTYDFSEENIKNLMALYSNYGWDHNYGVTLDTNNGGFDMMSWAYLSSWLGPINDMDDVYDALSTLSPVFNSIVHVQNIVDVTPKYSGDRDTIKTALMKYGAVVTAMYYNYNYYNFNTHSYWYKDDYSPNHAVTIVGWDDNYSKSNFKSGSSIEGDGAWIVRNSWGSDWGDKGDFYISYYDNIFLNPQRAIAYTFILNDTIALDKNYQYDIAGVTDYFYNAPSSVLYKNLYTSTDDEFLAAVSTYFEKLTNWTVTVKVNGEFKTFKSGISNSGYYTFYLDEFVPLKKGDIFEVIFNITTDGSAGFPISEAVALTSKIYSAGTSYASWDGENWVDLYDFEFKYSSHSYNSQVACIKAFTFLNPIETSLSLNISYNLTNPVNITVTVIDQYGNLVSYGNVTLNLSGIEYVLNLSDGKASMRYDFEKVSNNVSAVFGAVGYSPSYAEDSVVFPKTKVDLDLEIFQTLNDAVLDITCLNEINATLIININDKSSESRLINGKTRINLINLSNGVYNINITLPVDSIYECEDIIDSFVVNVSKTRIIADDLTFGEREVGKLNVTLVDENSNPLANRLLNFKLGNYSFIGISDEEGKYTLPLFLENGEYGCYVEFNGDNNHFKSNATVNISVEKFIKEPTRVLINLTDAKVGDDVNVGIRVLNASGDVLVMFDGVSSRVSLDDNGSAVFVVESIGAGGHVLDVVYLGSDIYEMSNASEVIEVSKLSSNVNLTVGSAVVGGDVDVVINVPGASGDVLVMFDGVSSRVSLDDNGSAVFVVESIGAGGHVLDVVYLGSDIYEMSNASEVIEVSKLSSNVNLTVGSAVVGEDVNVDICVLNASGDVLVMFDGVSNRVSLDENGTAGFVIESIGAGSHVLDVVYLGSDVYEVSNASASIIVSKLSSDVNLTVGSAVVGEDIDVVISVPGASGDVLVMFDGVSNRVSLDENGTASFVIEKIGVGRHVLDVVYLGSDIYEMSNASEVIDVSKLTSDIKLTIGDIKIGIDTPISIEIPGATGEVHIYFDENETVRQLTDGKTDFNVSGLAVGNHNIHIIYLGDDTHDWAYLNKFIPASAISSRFTNMTVDGKGLISAVLVDGFGNIVPNAEIIYKIANTTYSNFTDENGEFAIKINSNAVVEINYCGDDLILPADIAITINNLAPIRSSTTVVGDNYTQPAIEYKLGERGGNFTVQLLDQNGKPLSNKTVYIGYNGKCLERTTDENGFARVQINLVAENRLTFAVAFLGDEYYNATMSVYLITITKKAVKIDAQPKTYKASAKTKSYTVTLTTDKNQFDGKTYFGEGKKVTMTVNGKTYSAKTDSNGHATFKLNMSKKGTYSATISYAGDNTYASAKSTAKITIN